MMVMPFVNLVTASCLDPKAMDLPAVQQGYQQMNRLMDDHKGMVIFELVPCVCKIFTLMM